MMQNNKLSTPYVLMADIGGSHITVTICNILTYTIIPESLVRVELSSQDPAETILTAWKNAFKLAMKRGNLPVSGIGIAMPGPFDYNNGISYITGLNKYEALYGMDIRAYLANALQLDKQLIRFRNDAEATIAGEALAGSGKGFKNVMGVTLGTGFGSAHYYKGITRDLNLGSEPFMDSIADDHLSTRWFLKRYHELTGQMVSGVKDIALLAPESSAAKAVFEEFAINMSDFLAEPVAKLNPDVLVICGNIARASARFLPSVKKRLNSTHIRIALLGENAALIGAADLFGGMEIGLSDTSKPIETTI
jgi:glucokinase